jgi:hypothetical protein
MSGMYNSHRGMVPAPSRLNELLDQVRAEFDTQQARNGEYEHKSTPDLPCLSIVSIASLFKLTGQLVHLRCATPWIACPEFAAMMLTVSFSSAAGSGDGCHQTDCFPTGSRAHGHETKVCFTNSRTLSLAAGCHHPRNEIIGR